MSKFFKLGCYQGSALEEFHLNVLKTGNEDIVLAPDNDGTNGCTFLTLRIAQYIYEEGPDISWDEAAYSIDLIIDMFPREFNLYRDKEKLYCVEEANEILFNHGSLAKCNMELVSSGCTALSNDGSDEIKYTLCKSGGIFVITIEPYTFLYGQINGTFFIVDTHSIPSYLGGDGNAITAIFDRDIDCLSWMMRRSSSVAKKESYQEILQLNFETVIPRIKRSLSPDGSVTKIRKKTSASPIIISSSDEDVEDSESRIVEELKEDLFTSSDESIIEEDRDIHDNLQPTSSIARHASSDELSTSSEHGDTGLTATESQIAVAQNYPTSHHPVESRNWGSLGLPFIATYTDKLSNNECYDLVESDLPRCTTVPQSCKENAVFLIDTRLLVNVDDVRCDMNGAFRRCIESKPISLDIIHDDEVGVVSLVRSKNASKIQNPIRMHVKRYGNDHGLIRNIVYFEGANNKALNNTIILQYYVDRNIAGDVQKLLFSPKPHGNSKSDQQFLPTKKSVLQNLQTELKSKSARKVYNERPANGTLADNPRNMKQLYNLLSATKPRDVVASILSLDQEVTDSGDEFLWLHNDVPSDLWVLGKNWMIKEVPNAVNEHPLSVDPTFNFGTYEVTPFTYRSILFQTKSSHVPGKWSRALLPGPSIIHHFKDFATYDFAVKAVSQKLNLENVKFGAITDGESALIKACKNNFKKVIMGRCTNHFQTNCKDFIDNNMTVSDTAKSALLEVVFGDNGLIEAEDKKDLRERMQEALDICDTIEIQATNASEYYVPRFSAYIKSNEKSVIRQLIRDTRIAMKMATDGSGLPQRLYTNQSETLNSMLSAKKTSLGYGKKTDVSIGVFIRDIWLGVVREIDNELQKALCNQSDKYRLSPKAKYLEIDPAAWCELGDEGRSKYLNDVRALSGSDLDSKKNVPVPCAEVQSSKKHDTLSMSLSNVLPNIFHVDLIEKKALELLNSINGIKTAPSLGDDENSQFLVVGGKTNGYHKVSVTSKQNVRCHCKGYQLVNICSHSAAVAERVGLLEKHATKAKVSCKTRDSTGTQNRGDGRKGKVHRRHREYGNKENVNITSHNMQNSSPFSETWHNNRPLVICYVRDIPKGRNSCGQCGKEFSLGILTCIPFDIAYKHEEKWNYPNKNVGPNNPKRLVSKHYTTKYYCINKECIMRRFPYFVRDLISVPSDVLLRSSHINFIKSQFGYDLS